MMQVQSNPRIARWPFFLGDLLLLGLACGVAMRSPNPAGNWEIVVYFGCVAAGAALCVWPFVLEYQSASRMVEAEGVAGIVEQIQQLDAVAEHIRGATAQWQSVQETADKTRIAAGEIAERMAAEARAFTDFMSRANDSEKATLRLEVEKLRRSEADWIHVAVRILDHVYALHRAGIRSGKPELIAQLGHFQNACRDAARRIGLVPFVNAPDEPFDERRHHLPDGEKAAPGAIVEETIASGYTFQGQLVRPALVQLRNGESAAPAASENNPTPQGRLALDSAASD